MIRVVHSSPVWLAQTQTWVDTQVRFVPAGRVENHVVCERTENLDQFPVAHLHAFTAAGSLERLWDRALRRAGFRRHLGYLVRVAQRVNAAILHSHFGDVGWRDRGAARAAGCRHVVTFYGYDMSRLAGRPPWRERYRACLPEIDLVLCEGPFMAQRVQELGCPKERMRVHHLGIALEKFPYRPRAWRPGEPLKVLIAASFTEKKGIPDGLRALGALRREVPLEVTIIGDAHPGGAEHAREKERIIAEISRQGLGNCVRLTGGLPHAAMIEEAYRHHLFLSPSLTAADGDTEGGAPVSLLEMAASGMLIVSTRHCDIPEVVLDGVTGLLAEERDVAGLRDAMSRAIAEPQRWPEMLERGRRRVEAEFDARVQGERLAALYEGLVHGKTPA
jgi:colanic acid/amylovoran biosynthesis glycosyltransferase